MSAPEASMARLISSLLRYFPVPTIRRERKLRPAIVSRVSVVASVREAVLVIMIQVAKRFLKITALSLSSSDEVHQFNGVSVGKSSVSQVRPPNDLTVELHD